MTDRNPRATAGRSSKVSNEPVFTALQLQAFAEDHRRFRRRRWLRDRPSRIEALAEDGHEGTSRSGLRFERRRSH